MFGFALESQTVRTQLKIGFQSLKMDCRIDTVSIHIHKNNRENEIIVHI